MLRIHHLVPEQMFSTDDAKAQGVSAVKALALANAEGQKIWTITQDNLNQALNNIDLGIDVETEIRNAVNNGHVATAHEYNINFNGWIGSGYLLIDADTGAGAYKIAGGLNGGLLWGIGYFLGASLAMISLNETAVSMLLRTPQGVGILLGFMLAVGVLLSIATAFIVSSKNPKSSFKIFIKGISAGAGVASALGSKTLVGFIVGMILLLTPEASDWVNRWEKLKFMHYFL